MSVLLGARLWEHQHDYKRPVLGEGKEMPSFPEVICNNINS